MKYKNLKALNVAGILLIALVISGCSADRVSLTDKGFVSVEKQDSPKVKILWNEIYQQNGKTWLYGVLKQQGINTGAVKTHVDIQVLNADGSIQYETITDDLLVPRNRIGKGTDWKRFRVQLPDELPKDSQVSMAVDSGSHKEIDKKS